MGIKTTKNDGLRYLFCKFAEKLNKKETINIICLDEVFYLLTNSKCIKLVDVAWGEDGYYTLLQSKLDKNTYILELKERIPTKLGVRVEFDEETQINNINFAIKNKSKLKNIVIEPYEKCKLAMIYKYLDVMLPDEDLFMLKDIKVEASSYNECLVTTTKESVSYASECEMNMLLNYKWFYLPGKQEEIKYGQKNDVSS